MATKLHDQTDGNHIFMHLALDSGHAEEIDAHIGKDGWTYRTTADCDPGRRLRVIAAFHELY